jgi:hypothetical protein
MRSDLPLVVSTRGDGEERPCSSRPAVVEEASAEGGQCPCSSALLLLCAHGLGGVDPERKRRARSGRRAGWLRRWPARVGESGAGEKEGWGGWVRWRRKGAGRKEQPSGGEAVGAGKGVGGVIEGVRLTCGPHEWVVGIKDKYEGRWMWTN